jgi:hypothetical protein
MEALDDLFLKNRKTGERERIPGSIMRSGCGDTLHYCESELDAFKIAYLYRNMPHNCIVDYSELTQKWVVVLEKEDRSPRYGWAEEDQPLQ